MSNLRDWMNDLWDKLRKRYDIEPDEHSVYAVEYAINVVLMMAQGSNFTIEVCYKLFERMIDTQMRVQHLMEQNSKLMEENRQLIALLSAEKGIINKN